MKQIAPSIVPFAPKYFGTVEIDVNHILINGLGKDAEGPSLANYRPRLNTQISIAEYDRS